MLLSLWESHILPGTPELGKSAGAQNPGCSSSLGRHWGLCPRAGNRAGTSVSEPAAPDTALPRGRNVLEQPGLQFKRPLSMGGGQMHWGRWRTWENGTWVEANGRKQDCFNSGSHWVVESATERGGQGGAAARGHGGPWRVGTTNSGMP